MFDLIQLQCFLAVAEELHFGRAAARLNMTQPPLSRQIQVLERILNVTLLERTSRAVRLTPAGRSFLPEARRLTKMADAAVQLAKRVDLGKSGVVRLTFTASSTYSYLPTFVAMAEKALPDTDFMLNEMVTREQIEALLSGQSDIGLMRPPVTHPLLESKCVLAEGLVAAVPAGHPLAGRESVSIADFDNVPFLMYAATDARYFHDIIVSLFWAEQVRPKVIQQLTQIHSTISLVKAGLGCAFVPESARNLHWDGVVLLPLITEQSAPIELHMVWRRARDNPLVDRVLELAAPA